jgi:hypothetical protein
MFSFSIEVFQGIEQEEDQSLYISFNDPHRKEIYKLEHYHYNTLSRAIDWDDNARRSAWPVPDPNFYLLRFVVGKEDDPIDRIKWIHDPDVPDGEIF